MAGARDRVALGVIGRPHGVKGLVRIRPYTERPGDVAAYGPVALADGRRFEVTVVGEARGTVTARLSGVTDRDAAAALTGREIFVARAALPETVANEYYHHDLIGLAAEGVDGMALGRVVAVHDFGAGPVLEIARENGGSVMVPFTDAVVPEVDMVGGRMVIDPPPGLLDEDEVPGTDADDEDGNG